MKMKTVISAAGSTGAVRSLHPSPPWHPLLRHLWFAIKPVSYGNLKLLSLARCRFLPSSGLQYITFGPATELSSIRDVSFWPIAWEGPQWPGWYLICHRTAWGCDKFITLYLPPLNTHAICWCVYKALWKQRQVYKYCVVQNGVKQSRGHRHGACMANGPRIGLKYTLHPETLISSWSWVNTRLVLQGHRCIF